ncbi:MAG: hypothetical protein CMJ83_18025 [Planctomycetes bacterium]|nr:hypothetical protein [Planctomycetota bacterium]
MRKMLSLLPAILVSLTVSARSQDGFETDWQRESAAMVPALEELAEFARKHKLFRECIRTYDLILIFSPDHEKARRFLRYSRKGKHGPWERRRPFKEPKNLSMDSIDEFKKRRKAIVGPFARSIVQALDTHKDTVDAKQRQEVLRKLIRVDPENPEARAAFGDVKSGDRWLPEDAVIAALQRVEMRERAESIRDGVDPPRPTVLSDVEAKLGIRFLHTLETSHVRVLSTADGDESSKVVRYCEAAPRLFNLVLKETVRHREKYTVYLLAGGTEKKQFLDRHPDINASNRRFYEPLAGGWVNKFSGVCDWAGKSKTRIDYAVRQTNALCLTDAYGISIRQGWAFEGFGLYLTDLICNTKLTYYVKPSPYGAGRDSLRERLMRQEGDWFKEGLALLKGPKRPDLGRVITLDATAMIDEDMLYAYVLAAWLIETRSTKLRALLRDIARVDPEGKPLQKPAEVLKKHLGLGLDGLELRIIRWLEAVTEEHPGG